ncbi:MAG: DUF4416 family protein [candidate division Zixibacteria bacterium]|nr:DUF4416 family protein [candidate division Zixibacteria bacterium]
MGEIRKVDPVKLIAGIIYSDELFTGKAVNMMVSEYGDIDIETEPVKFDQTDYYADEMGGELYRKFISFEKLIAPNSLSAVKRFTNDIELRFALPGCEGPKRRINIDPGYLELSKLVLASTKNFSHRVYLGNGIYGEVTMIYRGNRFNYLEWTYPDYQTDYARIFLEKARAQYNLQLNDCRPR